VRAACRESGVGVVITTEARRTGAPPRTEDGVEYALLIYGDEKAWADRSDAEIRELNARHERFAAMLVERGAMRGGKELALAGTATTLRRAGDGDGVSITDGPFAETTEVLGGFYLIEAADLDEAIALARQVPELVVEVRPIVPQPGDGS
jgi:hypothetical protein